MIPSRIDFLKSTDLISGTVTYTTNQIFPPYSLSPEATVASFDASYSIPRSFRFVLDSTASFFTDFMRVQNTKKVGSDYLSLYFIRAYDENNDLVFSGLMDRNDYSVNKEKSEIKILSKDFSVLLSYIKNVSLAKSDRIANSLDDRATVYDYYIDQATANYFNAPVNLKGTNNLVASIKKEILEYNDKNVKLIDIMNMFTSLNNHVVRCSGETIIYEDSEYNNVAIPSVSIDESDFVGDVNSAVSTTQLNTSVFTSNLKDDQVYQNTILNIFYNSSAKFAGAIDTKVPGTISFVINDYTLYLNQVIVYSGKNYSIKSINKRIGRYDVILWNAKNPPTGSAGDFIIGTVPFKSTTNQETTDDFIMGTSANNNDTTDDFVIGTEGNNSDTTDDFITGTEIHNTSTTDDFITGTEINNNDTSDDFISGNENNNTDTTEDFIITDNKS